MADMIRVFPACGKFEERTRAEGLHLWYDIKYENNASLSNVIKSLKKLDQISYVEPIYKVSLINVSKAQVVNVAKRTVAESTDFPFNDPLLKDQWHYYNDGTTVKSAIRGADINLFPAWEKETGIPTVIVAVVDGGIDVTHEDLKQNVWVNTAEDSGNRNSDDDGNGYIDDINGYNFVSRAGRISAHDHGTHVAGTVAAVNNNGIGVSGVAGGNGQSTSGIRLMSCQVFATGQNGDDLSASSFEEAIKYGADNGAVISQNSWGYDEIDYVPASMKAAIDYFIKYAGVDENGNQVGPVKGGVVIFAAGNENTNVGYPAMYEEAVAVSSIAPDFVRAYYSNYGSWVDISAPGGTIPQGSKYSVSCQVLSTLPNNTYGYMQGTSMACPHVSGVAALVASQFGGIGFTADMLRTRLTQGATDLNYFNSRFINQLGAGLINASAALASTEGVAPNAVEDFELNAQSNMIKVKWSVTADEDDLKATGFIVYYSSEDIEGEGLLSNSQLNSKVVETGTLSVGNAIETELTGLDFATEYHISIVAFDVMRNYSEMSPVKSIATESNNAPLISTNASLDRTLNKYESITIPFEIVDPDGHTLVYTVTDNSGAVSSTRTNNVINLRINGLLAAAGSYNAILIVTDMYGAESSVEVKFTIRANQAPQILNQLDNVYIGRFGKQLEIDLTKYFSDPDGEKLSYNVSFSSKAVHASVSQDILYLTGRSSGLSDVELIATDNSGERVVLNFKVLVRDDSQEVDLYPMPVKDVLNIRMGEDVTGTIDVAVVSLSGNTVLKRTVEINPFSPGQLNLSDIPGGSYRIELNFKGKALIRNIVKL